MFVFGNVRVSIDVFWRRNDFTSRCSVCNSLSELYYPIQGIIRKPLVDGSTIKYVFLEFDIVSMPDKPTLHLSEHVVNITEDAAIGDVILTVNVTDTNSLQASLINLTSQGSCKTSCLFLLIK